MKFLGLCLVVAALIVGAAVVYHARGPAAPGTGNPVGRYQFQPSNPPGVIWVIDTTSGEVKYR